MTPQSYPLLCRPFVAQNSPIGGNISIAERLQIFKASRLLRKIFSCRFLAMVNQLHHLEALVVCDAYEMDGDFGKVDSHPSLQTIKLVTEQCTPAAFTSVLQLQQLQELWMTNMCGPEEVNFYSCLSSTAN